MAQTKPSLYVDAPEDFENVFRLATYNIDEAVREESVEETKWHNRERRVAALINEMDASIVCLQELRNLPNNITVNEWLGSRFPRYRYEIAYRNASRNSFAQATLYDPTRFFPLRTERRWFTSESTLPGDSWSTSGGGWGSVVLATQFAPVIDGKIVKDKDAYDRYLFWVFNVHFLLEEEVKTRSCWLLRRFFKELQGDAEHLPIPVIVAGDMNLFPDRDAWFQRDVMAGQFADLGVDAKTLSGRSVEGTFIGYEQDEFKADLSKMVSRLDNVFGWKVHLQPGTDALLYTKTMLEVEPPELTTRLYPSDHLPLLLTLHVEHVKEEEEEEEEEEEPKPLKNKRRLKI